MKEARFRPAELGDHGLRHEVHVFLYRFKGADPEYLLLTGAPEHAPQWRPAVGAIGWEEDVRHAALRVAQRSTGLARPHDLLAPGTGLWEAVGDLRLVQWPVGLEVPHPELPPRLGAGFRAAQWCPFPLALRALVAPLQRQNLLQLHLLLAA